jgi:hypothetical protein
MVDQERIEKARRPLVELEERGAAYEDILSGEIGAR